MRALRGALVPFSKGLSIVHPRQPQGLPLRLEAGDNWKALMTRRKCPEVCYVPSLAHRRGFRLSMGATSTNCPPPPPPRTGGGRGGAPVGGLGNRYSITYINHNGYRQTYQAHRLGPPQWSGSAIHLADAQRGQTSSGPAGREDRSPLVCDTA